MARDIKIYKNRKFWINSINNLEENVGEQGEIVILQKNITMKVPRGINFIFEIRTHYLNSQTS